MGMTKEKRNINDEEKLAHSKLMNFLKKTIARTRVIKKSIIARLT
jgi:hypothetical protein